MIEAVSQQTFLISVGAVAYVALGVLTMRLGEAPPTSLDLALQHQVLATRWKHRRAAGVVGSLPGYPGVYFAATALLIWFLRAHGARGTTSLIIASVGGWATHRLIKLFVRRRRPESRAGHSHEFQAFPSGHTIAITAVALAGSCIFAAQGFIPATLGAAIAIGLPLLVGISRVVADEHWTTDVIGGWAGGVGMASIALLVFLHGAR